MTTTTTTSRRQQIQAKINKILSRARAQRRPTTYEEDRELESLRSQLVRLGTTGNRGYQPTRARPGRRSLAECRRIAATLRQRGLRRR